MATSKAKSILLLLSCGTTYGAFLNRAVIPHQKLAALKASAKYNLDISSDLSKELSSISYPSSKAAAVATPPPAAPVEAVVAPPAAPVEAVVPPVVQEAASSVVSKDKLVEKLSGFVSKDVGSAVDSIKSETALRTESAGKMIGESKDLLVQKAQEAADASGIVYNKEYYVQKAQENYQNFFNSIKDVPKPSEDAEPLLDYIRESMDKVAAGDVSYKGFEDQLDRISDSLAILQENSVKLGASFDNFMGGVSDPFPRLTDFATGQVDQPVRSLADLADVIGFDEYGGWYVSVLFFFFSIGQYSAGERSARDQMTTELTQLEDELIQMQEEAEAALASASVQAEPEPEQVEAAISVESTRIQALESENTAIKTQLDKLSSETEELRNLLKEAQAMIREIPRVSPSTEKVIAEESDVKKEPSTAAAAEKPKVDPTKISVAEPKKVVEVVAEVEEKEKVVKKKTPVAKVGEKQKVAKKKTAPKTKKGAKKVAKVVAEVEEKEKPAKKQAAPKTKKVAKKARRNVKVVKPKPSQVKAAKQAPSPVATTKKAKVKVAKSAKKTPKKPKASKVSKVNGEAAVKVINAEVNGINGADEPEAKPTTVKTAAAEADWSNLSPSTLRRKTVKDLTGYLTERGETVTDEGGKTLKKDLLVQAVLSA